MSEIRLVIASIVIAAGPRMMARLPETFISTAFMIRARGIVYSELSGEAHQRVHLAELGMESRP
jgi:hypothetical protein